MRLGLLALALLGALLVVAPSAAADLRGDCTAEVAGRDVAPLDPTDPDQAIRVSNDARISYTTTAAAGIDSWAATILYGPASRVVDAGRADEPVASAGGEVDLARHAWLGSGLYRMEASAKLADGSTCTAAFLVLVEGSPFTTVVGATAAAVAAVGTVGVAASSISAARIPPLTVDKPGTRTTINDEGLPPTCSKCGNQHFNACRTR